MRFLHFSPDWTRSRLQGPGQQMLTVLLSKQWTYLVILRHWACWARPWQWWARTSGHPCWPCASSPPACGWRPCPSSPPEAGRMLAPVQGDVVVFTYWSPSHYDLTWIEFTEVTRRFSKTLFFPTSWETTPHTFSVLLDCLALWLEKPVEKRKKNSFHLTIKLISTHLGMSCQAKGSEKCLLKGAWTCQRHFSPPRWKFIELPKDLFGTPHTYSFWPVTFGHCAGSKILFLFPVHVQCPEL